MRGAIAQLPLQGAQRHRWRNSYRTLRMRPDLLHDESSQSTAQAAALHGTASAVGGQLSLQHARQHTRARTAPQAPHVRTHAPHIRPGAAR
jgi:hypothetical protein